MSKTKVLIAEDYEALQQSFQIALEQEGYEVLTSGTCAGALELARKEKPDVVVLDMLMPDGGGMEFLRQFDAKKNSDTKIIVFSNLSSPELFTEAKELGAAQYLVKSQYTPKELAGVIAKMTKG